MRVRSFSASLALLLVTVAAHAQTNELMHIEQEVVRAAVANVAGSVVQIETLGGLEKVSGVLIGTGPTSGLIVSEDGYIISSAFNFIQQPSSILVTLPNGQRRPAAIVARDRSRMLVLLKVQADEPLPVPTATPRSEIQVGQTVVALGKTLDATRVNLSVGILSANNRIWGRAVQTDANVSPSNYGGPLIDLYGRVIGVLVPLSPESEEEVAGAEWYDSGIGFAVPLEDVNRQLERLKSGRDLRPGKLGIVFANADRLDPETKIAVVKLNSPAAQAGLQPGDRILMINGQNVATHWQVRHQLGPLYAGDPVELTVARNDASLEVQTTLTDTIPPYEHAFLGILPTRNDSQTGVVVRYVFPSSSAATVGLEVDDRLLKLDDHAVADPQQLRALLATLQPDQAVKLEWQHGDETKIGELTLSRVPEQIPDPLPPIPLIAEPGALQTGKMPIEIPEEPNRCTAFVPTSLNRGHQGGLLVLLSKPGELKVDDLIEQWRGVCEERDLVLLLPEPSDTARWQPTEAAYVRKIIDQAINRFALDGQRIVVAGEEAGGAMAYLVGFRHRDVVRGIVAVDAPIPGRVGGLENEPLLRLAVLTLSSPSSPFADRVAEGIKSLRELKFPVTQIERQATDAALTDAERSTIGRWVDNLDRL
jgi:serine protease Do